MIQFFDYISGMSTLKKIIVFVLFTQVLASCCKGPHEAPVLFLDYSEVQKEGALYLIAYRENETLPDTSYLDNVHADTDYRVSWPFDETLASAVLYIEDTNQRDSLSNFEIIRHDRCKKDIEEINYTLNGEPQSGRQVVLK